MPMVNGQVNSQWVKSKDKSCHWSTSLVKQIKPCVFYGREHNQTKGPRTQCFRSSLLHSTIRRRIGVFGEQLIKKRVFFREPLQGSFGVWSGARHLACSQSPPRVVLWALPLDVFFMLFRFLDNFFNFLAFQFFISLSQLLDKKITLKNVLFLFYERHGFASA